MWQRATVVPQNAHHLRVELDFSALHRNTTAPTQNSMYVSSTHATGKTLAVCAFAVPHDYATQPLSHTAWPHQAHAMNYRHALKPTARLSTVPTASAETKTRCAWEGRPVQGATAMRLPTPALKYNSPNAKRQTVLLDRIPALAYVMPPPYVALVSHFVIKQAALAML